MVAGPFQLLDYYVDHVPSTSSLSTFIKRRKQIHMLLLCFYMRMCICSFVPLVSRWPVGPNCQAPSHPPTSDGIIRHVRKIRLHQRAHYAVTKWYILDSCLQGQRAQNMFGSSKAVRCNLCIVQLCTNGNPAPKYQRPHPQAIASRHIWAHCEYSPHTLCVSKGGSDSLSHLLWSPDVRDLEYGFVPARPACRIWGSVMHRYQQWQNDTIETMI